MGHGLLAVLNDPPPRIKFALVKFNSPDGSGSSNTRRRFPWRKPSAQIARQVSVIASLYIIQDQWPYKIQFNSIQAFIDAAYMHAWPAAPYNYKFNIKINFNFS